MTLRHLRTFITVLQEGSISGAAEKLNISQPAVSLTIRELESYYGIKLFERISRKIHITPEGKEIYGYSIRIMTMFDEMNIASETLKKQQTIRVGSGIAIGKLLMPKLAKGFLKENADITLLVTVNNSPTIEQKIKTNEIDIGIMEGTIHDPGSFNRQVFQVNPLVAICNKSNPLSKRKALTIFDLASERFLLGEKSSDTRVAIENLFLSNNLHITPIWESSSTMALINAVREDLGISILPINYVNSLINNEIAVLEVDGLDLKRYVNIVYHKQRHMSPAGLRFIEFCKKHNKV